MNPHLSVGTSQHGAVTVVEVQGEVDLATAPILDEQLSAAIGPGTVAVDLTAVSFIDSTGLRVLLTAREAAEEAGTRLVMVVADGPVTKLFGITGVDEVFELAGSVDAINADG